MSNSWHLYKSQPSFVLGFHGTESSTVNVLLADPSKHLTQSTGKLEWLGHGIYFWENDPLRAYEWAADGNPKSKIKEPDAVGAILDLKRKQSIDPMVVSGDPLNDHASDTF